MINLGKFHVTNENKFKHMKIGLLLPNSKFYPYIGTDLYNGIKHFLGDEHVCIIKDTYLATPKENQQALKELILYDNVDMLVGFVGYKSITAIKPLIQQTKTPMILCNAGEHPLLKADISPYIVHCSLDMFNSVYFACKWAFQNIGLNYSRLSSFFEAGFPLAMATEVAANKYSGEIILTETTHMNHVDELKHHIDNVEKVDNEFVFLGYHGFDAVEVMQNLTLSKRFNGVPLVSAPFFTEPEIIQANIDNPIYSVKTWNNSENNAYSELKRFFTTHLKREPSFSGILAYEAVAIIKHCIAKNWSSKDEIAPLLNDLEIKSPRGTLEFNSELNKFKTNFYLFELNKLENGEKLSNKQIGTIVPDDSDWEILNNFKSELPGWQNTYLCN